MSGRGLVNVSYGWQICHSSWLLRQLALQFKKTLPNYKTLEASWVRLSIKKNPIYWILLDMYQ